MRVRRTIPVFRIFDTALAAAFYEGFLGFARDWTYNAGTDPQYWQVSRGGAVLHLTGHHGDCTPGALAFLEIEDIEDFHAELAAKDYPFNRPGLDPAPWGGLVTEVTDPFANRLRLSGPRRGDGAA